MCVGVAPSTCAISNSLAAGIRRVLVTETAICPAGEDTSGVKGSVRYDSSGLMCTR